MLRECGHCRGTEDAFLSRELDNERTILLGRWFHAVKLPEDVVAEGHPFHALFAGKSPPHLFVATADGRTRVEFDGQQTPSALWKAMTRVLKAAYRKDPDAAVKALQKVLDRLDRSDLRLVELEERLLDLRAAKGAGHPEVDELQKDIDQASAERQAALEDGARADKLELKGA